MRRPLIGLIVGASLVPALLAAQASEFGVRGLGYPGSSYSARARSMGGAIALFDPESALNPAAVGALGEMTAAFSLLNDSRTTAGPGGDGNVHGMRFPLFSIAGPLRQLPLSFGLSATTYMSRDFGLAFNDTVVVRGVPTPVQDSLRADGGLNDLRGTVVWRMDTRTSIGAAVHAYTGVTRIARASVYEDTGYVAVRESSEISASGAGFDLGIIKRLAPHLTVAGVIRSDGSVTVRRDSLTATDYRVDLPISLAAGVQYRTTPRLLLAAQGRWAGWHSANADITGAGGPGAVNTWELGAGAEYIRDLDKPYRLPLRFGVRHATLPFPLTAGTDPKETVASFGSGFLFARGQGGADITVERAWRGDGTFSEHAWMLSVTATLRPNRRQR